MIRIDCAWIGGWGVSLALQRGAGGGEGCGTWELRYRVNRMSLYVILIATVSLPSAPEMFGWDKEGEDGWRKRRRRSPVQGFMQWRRRGKKSRPSSYIVSLGVSYHTACTYSLMRVLLFFFSLRCLSVRPGGGGRDDVCLGATGGACCSALYLFNAGSSLYSRQGILVGIVGSQIRGN